MKKENSVWSLVSAFVVVMASCSSYGFEQQYRIDCDYSQSTQSKWFGNYYHTGGQLDNSLWVGGWGDVYISMLKMPVRLPVSGRVVLTGINLNLYSSNWRGTPTSMEKLFWLDSWSEYSTYDHWNMLNNERFLVMDPVPAPPYTGWYSIDISSEFYYWLVGTYPNNGIGLFPDNNDNRFNIFVSPRSYDVSRRPYVLVNYEVLPFLKMPLPGGNYWICTEIPGGSSTHQSANFYAVDFSYAHYDFDGHLVTSKTDIPILASADGIVIERGLGHPYNGNYVKIDHDQDNRWETGIQTVYLHMKDGTVNVQQGQHVRQGDVLGIMGNTGVVGGSTGIHLHFQVYYKHQGSTQATVGDNPMLNLVNIENTWYMTSFAIGYYYQSQNTHYSF